MGIKRYDKAFKERAVKLSYERSSVLQAARELGISDSQLSKWRKDYDLIKTLFQIEFSIAFCG